MQETDRAEHETYQYLRLAMVAALAALAVSLLLEYRQTGWCAQTSISAYYFTEVQAVFVGTLLVLGVALVVICGRLLVEDAFLNLAGLLAPIVAFAPTTEFNYCDVTPGTEQLPSARTLAVAYTDGSVVNNMWAYLVVVTLALAYAGYTLLRRRPNATTYWVTWGAAVLWLVAVGYAFGKQRTWFEANAHLYSAVTMLAFIFLVVCVNAVARAEEKNKEDDKKDDEEAAAAADSGRSGTKKVVVQVMRRVWRAVSNRYGLLALAMVVGCGYVVFHKFTFGLDHWFLWIEIVLLVLFAVFWLFQTFDSEVHDHDLRRGGGEPRDKSRDDQLSTRHTSPVAAETTGAGQRRASTTA